MEQEIKRLIDRYMLKQADPGGKPSHGREYGTEKLSLIKKWSSLSDRAELIDNLLKSDLTGEAKANVLVTLADAIAVDEKGLSENLIDVTAFITALTASDVLSGYPVWCYPNYIPILNTREATEKHYINRQNALVNLGRIGDGSQQLYRFLENFHMYFYVNNECLCKFVKDSIDSKKGGKIRLNLKKRFGQGKVGTATLVTDQFNNPFIMKTISLASIKKSTIGIGDVAPKNPIANAIMFGNNKFVTVGSDDFTNQTIMHMTLNLLLGHNPNYVYQYDAFMCDGLGINIMDVATEGDMYGYLKNIVSSNADDHTRRNQLLLESCADCLEQLLPLLAYLKTPGIGFMHNDFKTKNIFVNKTADGKILYLLADFDKSQITWKNLRFYNNNYDPTGILVNPSSYVQYNHTDPHLLSPGKLASFSSYLGTGINSEALGKSILTFTMFNSNGYYVCYDIYTLLFSMLFVDEVYEAYKHTEDSRFHRMIDELIVDKEIFTSMLENNMNPSGKTKRSEDDLQRITIINGILHKGNFEIKNNIDEIVRNLGLEPFDPNTDDVAKIFYRIAMDKSVSPIISDNGHLCLEPPKDGKCRTPEYRSSFGLLYSEDDVIPTVRGPPVIEEWELIDYLPKTTTQKDT